MKYIMQEMPKSGDTVVVGMSVVWILHLQR